MPNIKERQGKWQPYDALEGYQASLRKVEHEKGKIARPVLSPDALEELDEKLKRAMDTDQRIKISFYQDGYVKEAEGLIVKVDPIDRLVMLNSTSIKLSAILDIDEIYEIN
jgi:hypothetical protein